MTTERFDGENKKKKEKEKRILLKLGGGERMNRNSHEVSTILPWIY